jgi:hypothetical protein
MVENILALIFSLFLIIFSLYKIYMYFLVKSYINNIENIHNGKLKKLIFFTSKIDFILSNESLRNKLYTSLLSVKNGPYLLTKQEQIYVDNLINKLEKFND